MMIGYVILHYQVMEETLECINVLKSLDGEKQIVIVDNDSPNNSGKELLSSFSDDPSVDVIIMDGNFGFATANNRGYSYLLENFDCDFIVIMNNDIEITQNNFEVLVKECYRETRFAVMGPDIFSTTHKLHQNPKRIEAIDYEYTMKINQEAFFKMRHPIYMWIRSVLKKSNILKKNYYKIKNKNETKEFTGLLENVVLHGSFLVFSPIFFKKFSTPFFEETFLYYESEILDYFIRERNLKSVYNPEIKILHHQNVATKAVTKTELKRSKFTNENLYKSTLVFLNYLNEIEKNK